MYCCKFIKKPKIKRDERFGLIEINTYCFSDMQNCKLFSDKGCKHKGRYYHPKESMIQEKVFHFSEGAKIK